MARAKKTEDKGTGCAEYDTLTEQMEKAREKIADMGKDAVKALFKRFFAEHPKCTAIGWEQYTPHFNDGDACEFSVRDFYYTTKKGVDFKEVSSLYEEDEEDSDGAGFRDIDSDAKRGEGAIKEAVSRLRRAVNENIFETAFGDHVMVIATPKGFHVNETSHD